jgi:hypothetical protein
LGHHPTERDLDTIGIAIVTEVYLCRHETKWRVGVVYESQKQSRLFIEIQFHWRLPTPGACNQISVAVADLFRVFDSQFVKQAFDM